MKAIKLKKIKVEISKLVTMAEMGLGAVRPLNKEKENMDCKVKERRCMGSYTCYTHKRFRLLLANRWLAQSTGRKRTEEKNNKRNTDAGQRGPEHGKSQQDPQRHRQGVWFQTELQ